MTIISTCCNALTTLFSGDEGTNQYICSNCGKACDFKAGAPVERVERQTGTLEWEKEFDKLEVVYTIVNTESSVPLMLDDEQSAVIKAFIAKELATARAEGAQEERNKTRRAYCEVCRVFINVDTGERIDHAN